MAAVPESPKKTAESPAVSEREPRHRPRLGAAITLGMLAVLAAGYLAAPREHAPLPAVARYA